MEYAAVLGPDDVLTDRPFTDAANTMREVDVMRHMLVYERVALSSGSTSTLAATPSGSTTRRATAT